MVTLKDFIHRPRCQNHLNVSITDSGSERVNPLSPNSDENEISLHIITTCSNIQVMRRNELITMQG